LTPFQFIAIIKEDAKYRGISIMAFFLNRFSPAKAFIWGLFILGAFSLYSQDQQLDTAFATFWQNLPQSHRTFKTFETAQKDIKDYPPENIKDVGPDPDSGIEQISEKDTQTLRDASGYPGMMNHNHMLKTKQFLFDQFTISEKTSFGFFKNLLNWIKSAFRWPRHLEKINLYHILGLGKTNLSSGTLDTHTYEQFKAKFSNRNQQARINAFYQALFMQPDLQKLFLSPARSFIQDQQKQQKPGYQNLANPIELLDSTARWMQRLTQYNNQQLEWLKWTKDTFEIKSNGDNLRALTTLVEKSKITGNFLQAGFSEILTQPYSSLTQEQTNALKVALYTVNIVSKTKPNAILETYKKISNDALKFCDISQDSANVDNKRNFDAINNLFAESAA